MESQLRKVSSAGILSNSVIGVIFHSECRTKGKTSVENIAKHAGTVMDTLFCAVGSVGSLELPTGTGWISQRDIYSTGEHTTISRGHAYRGVCTQITHSAC